MFFFFFIISAFATVGDGEIQYICNTRKILNRTVKTYTTDTVFFVVPGNYLITSRIKKKKKTSCWHLFFYRLHYVHEVDGNLALFVVVLLW